MVTVLGHFLGALRHALPEVGQLLRCHERCRELAVGPLALIGRFERSANCDDPTRSRHLQLEVGVVGDGHELGVARSPQDRVVGSGEVDYLELQPFGAEVQGVAEGDGQRDLPEWVGLLSRDDAVEGSATWAQVCPGDS